MSSDTALRAGFVLANMFCGSGYFQLISHMNGSLDPINVIIGGIEIIASFVLLAIKMGSAWTSTWPFYVHCASLGFYVVYMLVSLAVNVPFLNKNGWKCKTRHPKLYGSEYSC